MRIQVFICLKRLSEVKWAFYGTMAAVSSSGWMQDMLVIVEEISQSLSKAFSKKKKESKIILKKMVFVKWK